MMARITSWSWYDLEHHDIEPDSESEIMMLNSEDLIQYHDAQWLAAADQAAGRRFSELA